MPENKDLESVLFPRLFLLQGGLAQNADFGKKNICFPVGKQAPDMRLNHQLLKAT